MQGTVAVLFTMALAALGASPVEQQSQELQEAIHLMETRGDYLPLSSSCGDFWPTSRSFLREACPERPSSRSSSCPAAYRLVMTPRFSFRWLTEPGRLGTLISAKSVEPCWRSTHASDLRAPWI